MHLQSSKTSIYYFNCREALELIEQEIIGWQLLKFSIHQNLISPVRLQQLSDYRFYTLGKTRDKYISLVILINTL